MTTIHIALAGLMMVCAAVPPALAQLAAQPFQAPPCLPEQSRSTASMALAAIAPVTLDAGCNPSGEITRDGNGLTVNLNVELRPNTIHNPGNPGGVADHVKLRSYGGCLSGPLLDMKPGNTLRVNLDNLLALDDPSCPGGSDPADGSAGCFNTINLHFHGLHVSPAGNSDNVLLNIGPLKLKLDAPEAIASATARDVDYADPPSAANAAFAAKTQRAVTASMPFTVDASMVNVRVSGVNRLKIPGSFSVHLQKDGTTIASRAMFQPVAAQQCASCVANAMVHFDFELPEAKVLGGKLSVWVEPADKRFVGDRFPHKLMGNPVTDVHLLVRTE